MNLITDRLVVTEFTENMAERVYLNSLDAATAKYIPDEVYGSAEEAHEALRFLISRYKSASGPFVYPFLLKSGDNIGYVQAVRISGGWEIGFQIAKQHSGRGYTTEALQAFLPAILSKLGISTVFGICLADNIGSQRVLEKCGFKKIYEGSSLYQSTERQIIKYQYKAPAIHLADCGESTPAWETYSGAPIRNTQGGFVVCNDALYSIGGRSDRSPSLENYQYDPALKQWAKKAPLKTIHTNGAYVSAKGKIHVIAGDPFSDIHEVYDPRKDEWSLLAPIPSKVQHVMGVAVKDKIYVMGGLESWQKVSNRNQVYDIKTDSWTEMAPMLTGKHGYSAIVHDDRIYVFGSLAYDAMGGSGVYGSNPSIEVYDTKSDTWESIGNMPTNLYLGAILAYGGEVLIIGGFRDGDGPEAAVDIFSLETHTFRAGSAIPKPFVGMGAVGYNDFIYVSGGADPSKNWIGNRELYQISIIALLDSIV